MSTASAGLSNELQQQIEQFQRDVLAKVPPEIVNTLRSTTEDLVRSGIAERSLRVGERAPDFALPNVRGETVTLASLLARGPAVVAFYRGVW
jgi:hypothetical protein